MYCSALIEPKPRLPPARPQIVFANLPALVADFLLRKLSTYEKTNIGQVAHPT
jgi:hypothetical protein